MRCAECGVELAYPHTYEDPSKKEYEPGFKTNLCAVCCPRCWGGPGKGPTTITNVDTGDRF